MMPCHDAVTVLGPSRARAGDGDVASARRGEGTAVSAGSRVGNPSRCRQSRGGERASKTQNALGCRGRGPIVPVGVGYRVGTRYPRGAGAPAGLCGGTTGPTESAKPSTRARARRPPLGPSPAGYTRGRSTPLPVDPQRKPLVDPGRGPPAIAQKLSIAQLRNGSFVTPKPTPNPKTPHQNHTPKPTPNPKTHTKPQNAPHQNPKTQTQTPSFHTSTSSLHKFSSIYPYSFSPLLQNPHTSPKPTHHIQNILFSKTQTQT